MKNLRNLVLWMGMSLGLGMVSYKSSADSPEALANIDPPVETYNPPKENPNVVEPRLLHELRPSEKNGENEGIIYRAQDLMDGRDSSSLMNVELVPGVRASNSDLEQIVEDNGLMTSTPKIELIKGLPIDSQIYATPSTEAHLEQTVQTTDLSLEPAAIQAIEPSLEEYNEGGEFVHEQEVEFGGKKRKKQRTPQQIEFNREQKQEGKVTHHTSPARTYQTPEQLGLVPIPFNLENANMELTGVVNATYISKTNIRAGLRSEHLSAAFGETSVETGTETKYDVDGNLSRSQLILLTDMDAMAAVEAEQEKAIIKSKKAQGAAEYYYYMNLEKPPRVSDLIDMLVSNNLGFGAVQSVTQKQGITQGPFSFGLRQTDIRDPEGHMIQRDFYSAAYQGVIGFAQDETGTTIVAGPNDELNIRTGFLGVAPDKVRREGTSVQLNLKNSKARVLRDQVEKIYEVLHRDPAVDGWSLFRREALNSQTSILKHQGYQLGHMVDSAGERTVFDLSPLNSQLGFGPDFALVDIGAIEGGRFFYKANELLNTSSLGFVVGELVSFATDENGENGNLKVTSPELKNVTYLVKTVNGVDAKSLLFPNYGVSLFDGPLVRGVKLVDPDDPKDYLSIEEVQSADPTEGLELVVSAQYHGFPVGIRTGNDPSLVYADHGITFMYDGEISRIKGRRDLGKVFGFDEKLLVIGADYTDKDGQSALVQTEWDIPLIPGTFVSEFHFAMEDGFKDGRLLKWQASLSDGYWSLDAIQKLNEAPGFGARINILLGPSGGLSARLLYQLDNPLAGGEHTIEGTLVGTCSR